MKIFTLVAVAAIGLSASVAMAQNGSDVTGGSVSSTVGGGLFSKPYVPPVAVVPPATPVAVTPPAPPASAPPAVQAAASNVAAVTTGTPAAVASFTQNLQTTGVSATQAQGVANALQAIGSSPTVASINTAIATWNATISTMSPTQVRAFITSPSGRAALSMMRAARAAAGSAG